jgi:ribosomal protein L20A (L18A)
MKAERARGGIARQGLLIPDVVEMSPEEAERLVAARRADRRSRGRRGSGRGCRSRGSGPALRRAGGRWPRGGIARQGLLIPDVVEMSPEEAERLVAAAPDLDRSCAAC